MRAKLWRSSASDAGRNNGTWCTAPPMSSSMIVPVAVPSPMLTPAGRVVPAFGASVTVKVSSGSSSRSCTVATEKAPEVPPAAMLTSRAAVS